MKPLKILFLALSLIVPMIASAQNAATFAEAKGTLPSPMSGSCKVLRGYGTHVVAGLEIGSKGIYLQGKSGHHARAVFDGKVSAVYKYDTGYCVILRHGSYLTVYARLESVNVKKGQAVKALANLGKVGHDAEGRHVLHFQIRQEREPLNPTAWIKF